MKMLKPTHIPNVNMLQIRFLSNSDSLKLQTSFHLPFLSIFPSQDEGSYYRAAYTIQR